jgi:hypothetical protein
MNDSGKRYIGLDVHKHYLIALGVDGELQVVLPARRVELTHLAAWMKKTLTRRDEVVLEMTANIWQLYDELVEYAGSVTVVHPPHVALITRSQVMNDKIAASILAAISQGLASWDLGAATGNPRTAWAGGATTKDDPPGKTSEEPPACSDPKASLAAACGESLRENK